MGARSGRGCGEGGAPAAEQLGSGEAGRRCGITWSPSSSTPLPDRALPRPGCLSGPPWLPAQVGPARPAGPTLFQSQAAFAAAGSQWPAEPSPPPPPCPQSALHPCPQRAGALCKLGNVVFLALGSRKAGTLRAWVVAGDIANDAWPESAELGGRMLGVQLPCDLEPVPGSSVPQSPNSFTPPLLSYRSKWNFIPLQLRP